MQAPADAISASAPHATGAAPTTTNTTAVAPDAAATAAAEPVSEKQSKKSPAWKLKRQNRTLYPLHKSRWITRAVTFVVEFVAFFIVVGISAQCASNSNGGYCDGDPFTLIFIGLPMIWNIAEFITLCVNRRGIHPGAHIALDLISFGLLVGPGSTFLAVWSYDDTDYVYSCPNSGPCSYGAPRRRGRRGSRIAAAILMLIAGIFHLALFVIACISVHKWRMRRREEHLLALQNAYRQPPPGHISIAGNMDPNMAYLVTYPDGRQVLVPPTAAQQHPPMPHQQHGGFYAPQPQPQYQQYGTNPNPMVQVAPVPAGAAMGAATGAHRGFGSAGPSSTQEISPQQRSSSPQTQASDPFQQPYSGTNSTPTTAGTQASASPAVAGTSAGATGGGGGGGGGGAGYTPLQHQGNSLLSGAHGNHNRHSLYAPNGPVEAPEHGTTPRTGEAVPMKSSS